MAKNKTQFYCTDCGQESSKWLGCCPGCGAWNTMVEHTVAPKTRTTGTFPKSADKARRLVEVDTATLSRRLSHIGEFDRVLGGGLVPGSLVLLGGDPGIGKSTLLLQAAAGLAASDPVLYVSGEESALQTRMRAERLGVVRDNLYILTTTVLEDVLREAVALQPVLLVIDSIQTMSCGDISSAPGSVTQVREATAQLLRFAKETGISVAIIGHMTKEGNIAGPRMLEHMVDVVLYFEGERNYAFRVLRAGKNRFGSVNESGIFSMEEQGLVEVANPSGLLLSERTHNLPGSVVLACLEGVRPLLVELQALVSTTVFGMPRRMAAGFDYNRLVLLNAVLEKRVGLPLGNQDVYVNAVGGIRIEEPAADLAVVLAVASSFRNLTVGEKTVVMGEVGLTGEVRSIPRAELRAKEAAQLGFTRILLPKGNAEALRGSFRNLELIGVSHIKEAMKAVFQKE